jgi:hypothetical protein
VGTHLAGPYRKTAQAECGCHDARLLPIVHNAMSLIVLMLVVQTMRQREPDSTGSAIYHDRVMSAGSGRYAGVHAARTVCLRSWFFPVVVERTEWELRHCFAMGSVLVDEILNSHKNNRFSWLCAHGLLHLQIWRGEGSVTRRCSVESFHIRNRGFNVVRPVIFE